ncbi:MAG TPA: hypothetical protein VHF26_04765, partial [Trebonia sp.]|nr:hypothetical protein [Trebonia sp.]
SKPAHPAALSQPDPGGLLRSLVVDLALAAAALIACLIGAVTLIRLRRARRTRAARSAAAPGHPPSLPRHARGQTRTAPAPVTDRQPVRAKAEQADVPLAPWERSSADFAAAPVQEDGPSWPVSASGPMYVWNPTATTGPLGILGSDEPED